MGFTLIKRHQLSDQIITDAQVDNNADIAQSKIHNLESDLADKLNRSGDTMTGPLVLAADPVNPLEAATKEYVDNHSTSLSTLITTMPFSWVDSHTVKIPAGFTCSNDASTDTLLYTVDVIADITQNGAGGLESGSVTPNTWYYLWAIKDTTNNIVSALLSTNSVNPSLPLGYSVKRRIPIALRTDSSSNIMPCYIETLTATDAIVKYFNMTLNKVGIAPVGLTYPTTLLSTTANFASPTDLDCSSLLPIEATIGIFNFSCEDGAAGDLVAYFRTKGSTTDEILIEANSQGSNDTNRDSLITTFRTDAFQTIQYKVTGQSGTSVVDVSVLGFYMPIDLFIIQS